MAFDVDPYKVWKVAFAATGLNEAGYVNNPKDKGGPTAFGVTEKIARAYGYRGDMRDMRLFTAEEILKKSTWDIINLDAVATDISPALAIKLYDLGVLNGPGTAIKFMQRALNVFNHQAHDYGDLVVDGGNGPVTMQSLRAYKKLRGEDGMKVLIYCLGAEATIRYMEIAEGDPTQEEFTYGWISKRT